MIYEHPEYAPDVLLLEATRSVWSWPISRTEENHENKDSLSSV